jgi:hypothetical protein
VSGWLTERSCPREAGDDSTPCPWVGCRHHVWAEVSRNGRRAADPLELETTCVLDAILERGSHTLAEAGAVLGVCRERVRQLEAGALALLADCSVVDRDVVLELVRAARASRDEREVYRFCPDMSEVNHG